MLTMYALPMFVVVTLLLLDLFSINHLAGVDGLHIRQTFYDSPLSSEDYSSATSNVGEDNEGSKSRSSSSFDDAVDYDDDDGATGQGGGYQDGDDGSQKQGTYDLGAVDDDAYAGHQSSAAGHQSRSSHRDSYEPVYHRKSKSNKGHGGGGGYNDEDDDDNSRYGYQEKKRKRKVIRPKVIIVKKIIPLSTTTAVNGSL